jgi:hypothetical protein
VVGQIRAAYVATRQAEGERDAAYRMRVARDGRVTAETPTMHMAAQIDEHGATLTTTRDSWHVTLDAASVWCEGRRQPLVHTGSPRVSETPNRVALAKVVDGDSRIDEWYENGPLGLEQGFTLDESPCRGSSASDVAIEVSTGGLSPALTAPDSAELRDAAGESRLAYTDLAAHDAGGAALRTHMSVEERSILLHVDMSNARFPVVIDPLAWVQAAEIVASDGASGASFGASVAVSGNTAIVGAPQAAGGQGAAYVFVQSAGTWSQTQKLVASDAFAGNYFGTAVSISGGIAIVGEGCVSCPHAIVPDGGSSDTRGAAYVFTESGGTWAQTQKLTASDAAIGDYFGLSVAVSGTTAVVGAPQKIVGSNAQQGTVYVFANSGGTWSQQQELLASDGATGDGFGSAVSVGGGVTLIGAPARTATIPGQGVVYAFTQSGSTWNQQQELVANDAGENDAFGTAVALSGATAVIGAAFCVNVGPPPVHVCTTRNANTHPNGAAYVFAQSGSSWSQTLELAATDGAAGDGFGYSLAISGGTIIAGAPGKTIGANTRQGASYVFTQSGSSWSQQQEILANDGAQYDSFGDSVATSGTTAFVGAPFKTVGANTEQGVGYVEGYGLTNGSACSSSGPACGSGYCVDGVCCDTPCSGLCQACTAALKQSGAADGTCGPAKAGTNPHNDPCTMTPVTSCGTDGKCDGNGACEYYAQGTSCGATCTANIPDPEICNGTGMCVVTVVSRTPPCTPYLCKNGVCDTSCTTTADCDPTGWCSAGQCVPKVTQGQPCTTTDACASPAVCVDGVCCDSACSGQCQACDVAGSAGMCTPITGAPHGSRPTCTGLGTACAGACDGVTSTTACQYPGASKSCGTMCTGATETDSVCDGMGDCVAQKPNSCPGGYACNGMKCAVACTTDNDCTAGFACTQGQCTPKAGAKCDPDEHTLIDPGGGRHDCSPYVCAGAACKMPCASLMDCVSPNVCNASGECIAAPTGQTGSSGGCSVGPSRRSSPDVLPMLLASLMFVIRSRTGRPRPARLRR